MTFVSLYHTWCEMVKMYKRDCLQLKFTAYQKLVNKDIRTG